MKITWGRKVSFDFVSPYSLQFCALLVPHTSDRRLRPSGIKSNNMSSSLRFLFNKTLNNARVLSSVLHIYQHSPHRDSRTRNTASHIPYVYSVCSEWITTNSTMQTCCINLIFNTLDARIHCHRCHTQLIHCTHDSNSNSNNEQITVATHENSWNFKHVSLGNK